MTEKRIIFVGHGKPCQEIANYVLACTAIASGGDLIPGMATRCFPYASLAHVDKLLKRTGFIAGVSNPVFEEQTNWWDICININTNKMTISQVLVKSFCEKGKDSSEGLYYSSFDDEEMLGNVTLN